MFLRESKYLITFFYILTDFDGFFFIITHHFSLIHFAICIYICTRLLTYYTYVYIFELFEFNLLKKKKK